jgi:Kef-type K+ transport system membrane component KefB
MENNSVKSAPVMSLKEWIITNIITYIPFVGLVMLFVWAFSHSSVNENKKNWAKALLFIQFIIIILVILFYVLLAIIGLTTQS